MNDLMEKGLEGVPGTEAGAGSALEMAISVAVTAHAGQTDKGGAPYILHPLRVMQRMRTEEERIVAVLHDVMEDCPAWGVSALKQVGVSDSALAALTALTRLRGESYDDFIRRCGENELARRVKLADLGDNMDMSRIPSPTPADYARFEKYERASDYLIGIAQPPVQQPVEAASGIDQNLISPKTGEGG